MKSGNCQGNVWECQGILFAPEHGNPELALDQTFNLLANH